MCGAGRIAAGVKQAFVTFSKEQRGVVDEGATKVFIEIMADLDAKDIFLTRFVRLCFYDGVMAM